SAGHAHNDAKLVLNVGTRAAGVECGDRLPDGLATSAAGLLGEEDVDVLKFYRRRHRDAPRSFGRLIRSKMIASSTMVNPASNPMPTCTEFNARTTGTPRPPAPTSAAITTIERLNMMHCVMPAMMVVAALGNSIFHSSCMGVAPKDCPASMSGRGTDEIP